MLGKPSEMAGALAYLASKDRDYITAGVRYKWRALHMKFFNAAIIITMARIVQCKSSSNYVGRFIQ